MLSQTFVGSALLCLCLFQSEAAVDRKEEINAVQLPVIPLASGGNGSSINALSTANELAVILINGYRAIHQAPPLSYDPELQILAKTCATLYTFQGPTWEEATDVDRYPYHKFFSHHCTDIGNGNNELIFHVDSLESKNYNVFAQEFHYFYDRQNYADISYLYDFDEPDARKVERQQYFTQMLWKSTTRIGCACGTKLRTIDYYICSCIFSPGGNVRTGFSNAGLSQYKQNVLRKK